MTDVLHVLIVTSEWPAFEGDISGIHVVQQMESLRRAGVNVDVFFFRGNKNPFAYWRAIREFRRMELKQYDVIHAHHGQSGIVALSQRLRPVVVTFHGSDLQGIRDHAGSITLLGWVLKWASSAVARYADEVILVSEHLKAFIAPRTYHVIPAGIDTNKFVPMPVSEARAKLNLPATTPLVLFVGDPRRTEKRFSLARDTVGVLKGELNVELVVAKGIPHHLMPLYMSACDVLLITSYTEGSPTIVKEALVSRLPIVSVDIGDIRASIGHLDGCVVSSDDQISTLASILAPIIEKPYRLGVNDNLSNLDEAKLIQKVISVYKKILLKKMKFSSRESL